MYLLEINENTLLYEWTELLYPFSIRNNNIIQSEYDGYNIPTKDTFVSNIINIENWGGEESKNNGVIVVSNDSTTMNTTISLRSISLYFTDFYVCTTSSNRSTMVSSMRINVYPNHLVNTPCYYPNAFFFVQFYSPLIVKSNTNSILSCSCSLLVRSCATSDAEELYDYYGGTVFLHCDYNQSVALSYIHVVENVFYSRYDYLQIYFGSNISVQIPSFASLTVFYTKKTK